MLKKYCRRITDYFGNANKDKVLFYISVLTLVIAMIPLIVASFNNHLYADDYSYGRNGMRILRQNKGILETGAALIGNAFSTMYDQWCNWSGCYTSFLFSSLAPGVWGDEFVSLNIFILLGSFLLANYFTFRIILCDLLQLDKLKVVPVFCFVTFISIQFVPSIPEAFYWFNGAFYNIVGYSLGLLQFALVLKLFFGNINTRKHIIGVLTIIVAILFGGTNYSCILLYMVLYFMLLVYQIIKKGYKNIGNRYAIASILIFYVCSFLNIAAPGNSQRQQSVGEMNSAIGAIYQAIMEVGPFIRDNFNLLQILLVLISLPLVYGCANKVQFHFKYPVVIAVGSYLSLAICFTPTCYALNSLGPNRTLNVYYFLFVLLLYVNIFYISGWISHNTNFKFEEFSFIGYMKYAVYIALFIMLLVPKDDMMCMSSVVTTRELLNGDLKEYDEQASERYQLYINPEVKEVVLEPLTVNPKCLTVNLDQNISTDPEWWVNRAICITYDKDVLYIVSE